MKVLTHLERICVENNSRFSKDNYLSVLVLNFGTQKSKQSGSDQSRRLLACWWWQSKHFSSGAWDDFFKVRYKFAHAFIDKCLTMSMIKCCHWIRNVNTFLTRMAVLILCCDESLSCFTPATAWETAPSSYWIQKRNAASWKGKLIDWTSREHLA